MKKLLRLVILMFKSQHGISCMMCATTRKNCIDFQKIMPKFASTQFSITNLIPTVYLRANNLE